MCTVKNAYREQVCLSGINGSKKGKSRYKTMNNADCIFYAKGIIHHEFVTEKQTVNGKF
jgi:hypothetical protein